MQIAIFGGSFDPIHIGHVSIVKEALKFLCIDKLLVVPTFLNPFKSKSYFSAKQRQEFLIKVFEDYEDVEICDYETKQNKIVYSIDTVKHIKALYNPSKIYFIIGSDNLEKLDNWKQIHELKKLVEFVVATRKGFEIKNKDFKTLKVDIDISSSTLRDTLDLDYIPKQIKQNIKRLNLNTRLEKIKNLLDEKKAEDIEIIDLTNKEYIVDYVVIATTLNPKHSFALLDYLKTELKPLGEEFLRVDDDEEWTICDLGDMFINLMSQKARDKYTLEDFLSQLDQKEE